MGVHHARNRGINDMQGNCQTCLSLRHALQTNMLLTAAHRHDPHVK